MVNSEDDLELLDVEPRVTSAEGSVSTGSSRRNIVFAGVGVVAAVVVAISLASGSSDDAGPETEPTVVDESVDDTSDDASDESSAADETADELADELADGPVAVGDALSPVDPFLVESGLTLYGQQDRGADSGMVGIDLDTGDVTNFGYPYDEVLLQSDDYLIVRSTRDERHSAISLETPTMIPRVVSQNTWVVAARKEGGENVVAFLTQVETEETLRYTEMTIDLDIGTIIFRGTLRDTHPFVSRNPLSTDTALFTGPTGGVYEPRGPNFEQVADGRVLGFDDNVAIIERCDDSLDCVVEWVQRSDWTVIDRPLPDREFDFVEILGGGRILLLHERFGSGHVVFDANAETVLDLPMISDSGDIAVSADGTTLAVAAGREGVVLVDVDSGEQLGGALPDLAGPLTFATSP